MSKIRVLDEPSVQQTLLRMHKEASAQGFTILRGLAKGIFRKLKPEDMNKAYIAISKGQGEYLYQLLTQRKAKHIVEFGTSFGISTLYLAAAAKANGGKVITTELLSDKCRIALKNFEQASLQDYIELREGNALDTLKNVDYGIDFLLMDGWNDLYLPLLELLEPKFKKGTLIYTDNASFSSAKPFLNYIKTHSDKYVSQRLMDDKGGSELTEFVLDTNLAL